MTGAEFIASEVWIREQLERHRSETIERGLQLHMELDPRVAIRPTPELSRAIDGLLGFVLATIPDGCEIFVASTATPAPVAPLGSGTLTLRWQVAGSLPPPHEGNVRPIRPIGGDATLHLGSRGARRVEALFEGLSADLEIFAAEGDRELWARVSIDP